MGVTGLPTWAGRKRDEQLIQERSSDLIGPYWGTYGIACRVLQPLLASCWVTSTHLKHVGQWMSSV